MSAWEATGKTDEWHTPPHIFDALSERFDLDVAAPAEGPRHVPCDGWLFAHSLDVTWRGFVWMNPPFGPRNGLAPWLAKFFAHGNGIALTPDRTSAPWWQDAHQMADAVLFTRGKVQFEREDGSVGKSPGAGVTLWASGGRAVGALWRAQSLGALVLPVRGRPC
jgi:hypothetical protein